MRCRSWSDCVSTIFLEEDAVVPMFFGWNAKPKSAILLSNLVSERDILTKAAWLPY